MAASNVPAPARMDYFVDIEERRECALVGEASRLAEDYGVHVASA